MLLKTLTPLLLTLSTALAQSNGCPSGFTAGTDTVIFTLPYTYDQVMSIIGSFRNITWSGSPYDTVTLNGTDNTVGTARTYDILGAHVVETITVYSKPPAPGPYEEIHTVNLVTIPSIPVSFSSDYDGTTVVETCGGKASTMNFTINFCADNATVAAGALHTVHLTDAQTVGVFLGGQNFTTCAALGGIGGGGGNVSVPATPSPTASVPPSYTAGAERLMGGVGGAVVGGLALLAWL